MEKRISIKINDYLDDFKNHIKLWIEKNDNIEFSTKSDLLKYIYDFNNISLEKEDFSKRKRIKSNVPQYLRCTAKRANGEQCSRKKKEDGCFCGTHDKNRPHGIIEIDENNTIEKFKKVEVWLQEINGILYYIDNFNNVYNTQDIITNKINPDVIYKYILENDKYTIIN